MDLESSRQGVKGSYSNILPSLRFSGSMNESRFPTQTGGYNQTTGAITLDKISSQASASSAISFSQNTSFVFQTMVGLEITLIV